ncbi:hypothetical protein OLL83_003278 [Shewanella algae]|uniref:hypothetical protein n=1 Tax=Shewanella algae TaxID=38313 RepID=UPI001AAE333B|nr:hypothetical protein [Shewanella algae]MBO2621366.1 hypothetical protein [Shewanella algae]UZD57498.1 hypothetical protein OLL83_003278 [Shewanella algae]
MKKLLILLMLCSPFSYGADFLECSSCSNSDMHNASVQRFMRSPIGTYEIIFADYDNATLFRSMVTVKPDRLGGEDFQNAGTGTITTAFVTRVSDIDNSYFRSLIQDINESIHILNPSYSIDASGAYRNVFEALEHPADFQLYLTDKVRRDTTYMGRIRQANASLQTLVANLNLSISIVGNGVTTKLTDSLLIDVNFSDGTSMEFTISFSIKNGEFVINFKATGSAKDADGQEIPKNQFELRNYSSGGVYSEAMVEYFNSINPNIKWGTGGSGGGTCQTEMTCNSDGDCIVRLVKCS